MKDCTLLLTIILYWGYGRYIGFLEVQIDPCLIVNMDTEGQRNYIIQAQIIVIHKFSSTFDKSVVVK